MDLLNNFHTTGTVRFLLRYQAGTAEVKQGLPDWEKICPIGGLLERGGIQERWTGVGIRQREWRVGYISRKIRETACIF
jgi:hypothetical protein